MSWPEALRAAAGALAVGALLGGCGLEPVHARKAAGGGVTAALAEIEVAPIPERIGQLLRRRLQERLAPGGAAAAGQYRLHVRLDMTAASALIGRGDIATRSDITMTAEFTLREKQDETPLLRGWARSVHSHDLLASGFATRAAERAARQRGVEALSAQIARRLALFFRGGAAAG